MIALSGFPLRGNTASGQCATRHSTSQLRRAGMSEMMGPGRGIEYPYGEFFIQSRNGCQEKNSAPEYVPFHVSPHFHWSFRLPKVKFVPLDRNK